MKQREEIETLEIQAAQLRDQAARIEAAARSTAQLSQIAHLAKSRESVLKEASRIERLIAELKSGQ